MKDQWSGTLVMILQPGEETGEGAKAMLDDGLYTRFPKPDPRASPSTTPPALPAGRDRRSRPAMRWPMSTASTSSCAGVGGHGAYPHTTRTRSCSPSRIVDRAADPGQPRERPARSGGGDGRQLPGRRQAQHHLRRGQAAADRAQLHAGGAQAAARRDRADRPRRGDRGRHARRPDAGGHHPRGRVYAGDLQHRGAVATARSPLFARALRRGAGDRRRRR